MSRRGAARRAARRARAFPRAWRSELKNADQVELRGRILGGAPREGLKSLMLLEAALTPPVPKPPQRKRRSAKLPGGRGRPFGKRPARRRGRRDAAGRGRAAGARAAGRRRRPGGRLRQTGPSVTIAVRGAGRRATAAAEAAGGGGGRGGRPRRRARAVRSARPARTAAVPAPRRAPPRRADRRAAAASSA